MLPARTSISRRLDWESRYIRALLRQERARFSWGKVDCCMAVCDLVLEMTGVDPVAEIRGTYASRIGAAKVFAAAGGLEPFIADVCKKHGCPEVTLYGSPIPCGLAHRGDVVLLEQGELGPALGIVDVNGCEILTRAPEGAVRLPLSAGLRAWHIPYAGEEVRR